MFQDDEGGLDRQFIFVYADQEPENLELRTIVVDNGIGKASRTLAWESARVRKNPFRLTFLR